MLVCIFKRKRQRIFFYFFIFLANLSWKLKWAFMITFCPESVCLSVHILFTSSTSSWKTTGSISNKLDTKHSWVTGICIYWNKGQHSFNGRQVEMIKKLVHVAFKNIFNKQLKYIVKRKICKIFSKTNWPK